MLKYSTVKSGVWKEDSTRVLFRIPFTLYYVALITISNKTFCDILIKTYHGNGYEWLSIGKRKYYN